MPNKSTRRDFLQNSAAIASAVYVGSPKVYAQNQERSANERVTYACIGVGGSKGGSDTASAAAHGDVIALCDVDDKILAKTGSRSVYKEAKRFNDFREMLDKMGDKIDAVTVTTPDHTHAPAAAMAMKKGIACFCQKPLTHTVWEARRLVEIAKETGVKTMMGNQGTAKTGLRHAAAVLRAGTLGRIKEAHIFTNRPVWPQKGDRPRPSAQTPPPHLHWDLWLSAAPERPYGTDYHPFSWRGWWDFGTGALGDMACHTFNMPFAGLNLANPKTIQATCTGHENDSYPSKSQIEFEFVHPSGEGIMPVTWYDGGNRPDESLLNGVKFKHKSGAIIVGEEFTLYSHKDYGDEWVLIDNDGKEVEAPEVDFERSPGHFTEFHESIIGKREHAMSNFAEYAGPLTETILLGNLAVWAAANGESKKIEWDAENLTATNAPEVMNIVKKKYRKNYGSYLDA